MGRSTAGGADSRALKVVVHACSTHSEREGARGSGVALMRECVRYGILSYLGLNFPFFLLVPLTYDCIIKEAL